MAVALGGGIGHADTAKPTQVAIAPKAKAAKPKPTTPAIKPRVLPSGAPACGNVMLKYSQPKPGDVCEVITNLKDLEALGLRFEAERQKRASLTLAPEDRPRL